MSTGWRVEDSGAHESKVFVDSYSQSAAIELHCCVFTGAVFYMVAQMNEDNLVSEFLRSWLYIAIAATGGVLGHMMRKLSSNQQINVGETLLQGVGAAFAGYLVLLGCRSLNVSSDVSGVVIGLCGWLGADATLMLLQSYIYKKLKLERIEERNDSERQ
ncbi:phage holin family protein [Pseudomonas sp. NFIX28]|uniref:phage holin family protein n=1 Tax=Pseudomonas sp. NFIX28 TaxID=1566235 RepID=UPI000B89A4C7|nr:phage holin family protein [Pseudomonas sp. NFIX28]